MDGVSSESVEDEIDRYGDHEERNNDNGTIQDETNINNNNINDILQRGGRLDSPHLQHLLDWERYRTNGNSH